MIIYLYVKQHLETGLKYFGKTTSKDPLKYPGSGKYWSHHCNKHGWEHVFTVDVWGFDNQDLCTEFALQFSKENDIVNSSSWANLVEENALPGSPLGRIVSEETKLKLSDIFSGKSKSLETRLKMSKAQTGKSKSPFSKEHREKLSRLKKGINLSMEHKKSISKSHQNREMIECSICGQKASRQTLGRYHKHI